MALVKQSARRTTGLETRSEPRDYGRSFRRIALIFAIPFILLTARLWYLQIWQNESFQRLAFNNFIKRTPVSAERGLIFDAKGALVAGNRPSYDVLLTPAFFVAKDETPEVVAQRLERLTHILALAPPDHQDLLQRIHEAKGMWRFEAILVKRTITRDQVAMIAADTLALPGVEIRTNSQRFYPFNDLAAHLIGYVNEINQDELSRLSMVGYRLGDIIGRTGIERSFEAILRGAAGLRAGVVDARGMPQNDPDSLALIANWRDVEPVPGKNIVLTVDMELQRILKHALRNYETGAIVALEPATGRILGIASKPAYNPNSWSGRLSRDEHIASDNNPYKPMLDKSLLAYFPGSVYKIITAAAALDTGLITPQETLHCPGYYEYGKQRRRFHCWKRSGHDNVPLTEAIASSCDVYFYKVGEKLGMETLSEYARYFGFGEPAGLGINIESPGLVPTREWHAKKSSEGFQGGFTLSTSIGQGDTKTSPLQMALAYGAIANGGTLYYPLIVDRIETAAGQPLFQYPVRVRRPLPFSAETIREIVHGLDLAVNHESGTAYAQRLDYVRVAGKTGTAQVISQRISSSLLEFKYRDHAWFAAFAPIEAPEIVVVVFLEHGGGGSSDAAPVGMEVLDRYFREIRGYDPVMMKNKQRAPVALHSGHEHRQPALLAAPAAQRQR